MTPTRPATLLTVVAVTAVLGYLLGLTLYGALPALPGSAPVPLVLLALAELALAKTVRDRVHRRRTPARGRVLHPLQVARAAALAKASSVAGAGLFGLYAGLLAWTAPRAGTLTAAGGDATVAGVTAVSALALTAAALLLERACLIAGPPDDGTPDLDRLGSSA